MKMQTSGAMRRENAKSYPVVWNERARDSLAYPPLEGEGRRA